MADISKAEYDKARSAVTQGTDPDLPDPADKRSRANFINGKVMAPNTTISVRSAGAVRVLGPGRGRDYFMAAWKPETGGEAGILCVGSFRAENIGEPDRDYVPPVEEPKP